MKIKIARREFNVTNDDIVIFNGVCYICKTLKIVSGWYTYAPIMSKTQAKKLIKNGTLKLVEEHLDYVTTDGREMWWRTYKFNVDHLE